MRKHNAVAAAALILAVTAAAGAGYHVTFDFETGWGGDYAPGWENTLYRHGDPPIGKMMQQVAGGHASANAVKVIADSVPEDWMWWAYVNPVSVSPEAMKKKYNPWISAWYYDENPTMADVSGYLFAVPSWVNLYIDGAGGPDTEDWTDVQYGARFAAADNYYHVECGENMVGWVDTGVARPTVDPQWVQLKMQLSSADGRIHYYINGVEVGSSYRDDYEDLGTEIGIGTVFATPLSGWSPDKPYTIWDDFEFGSSIPEPLTMLGVFAGVTGLAGYVRRRCRH